MTVSTEILVIGGGATGLGVARDAALRGFKTILVEKGDLAHGTSGRYHGLLHSGARYVVRDPQSAADCYRENLVLKRLMPSAIEDTGGFFASVPEDPPDYVPKFVAGCRAAGIPAEEVSVAAALKAEPLLNPRLVKVFHVPDGSCDSFDTLHLLAESVRALGGEVWLRHKVVQVLRTGNRVTGVVVENLVTAERTTVGADLVVNSSGAWAGGLAQLAGCEVTVLAGKGTMVAMNVRMVNTVISRLKPPSDGDILVPVGTVAVMGTTEIIVDNPDEYPMDDAEIDLLLAEGEKLVPRFREFRALRAWAGVRPLYKDKAVSEAQSRLVSRSHHILDHAERDGVEGFVSVVGGKFTTLRLMAEETLDMSCRKLKTERRCRTAETPIDPPGTPFYALGGRLKAIESVKGQPEVVCECELVTRAQVEEALLHSKSLVISDLRRDLRLGMGPCQAGFCAYRAAGILHAAGQAADVRATNSALVEFLQERWKGMRPVEWGANLRQLELDQGIYRNVLGVEGLALQREPEAYPSEKTA
jgi:glycerol-3-phosphate dehydrogenase